MPSKKQPTPIQKRRSPVSREVGRERLAHAAAQLLQERPFSSISVRDIAELADVNQRYIHTWFGSQHLLYLHVVESLFQDLYAPISDRAQGEIVVNPFDPNVRFATRLLIWLDLEGVDITPIITVVRGLMNAFSVRLCEKAGLNEQSSAGVALQGSAIGLGCAAFAEIIGADDPLVFMNAFNVWQHQIELLAKYPLP